MCMAALHWAQVDTVYFGATVQDAADAGFNELYIDAAKILSMGGSKVKLIGGVLAEECKQLFTIGRSYRRQERIDFSDLCSSSATRSRFGAAFVNGRGRHKSTWVRFCQPDQSRISDKTRSLFHPRQHMLMKTRIGAMSISMRRVPMPLP